MSAKSLEQAERFFKSNVLPRRVRDKKAEEKYFQKYGKRVNRYRKLAADEEGGELFPVYKAGLQTFAHFGIDVGIYFLQLGILIITTLIGGIILIFAMIEYSKSSYGVNSNSNPFVPISAACNLVNVTVTNNCAHNTTECLAEFRENCELPYNAGMSDLVMSIFAMVAVCASLFFENTIEEELDEAVQTAQDYSVVVNDPDADADDPDEWYKYFSQYGDVQYITITRKNSELRDLVAKKHLLVRKENMLENRGEGESAKSKIEKVRKEIQQVDEMIQRLCQKGHPTCRVYVTFNREMEQRHCLSELEVPNYMALLDIKKLDHHKLFRDANVLDVIEPPEPDSILWNNVELSFAMQQTYSVLSNACSFGILVACFFAIRFAQGISPLLLSVMIAVADNILPFVFEFLTNLSHPLSEGVRQSDLQVKLFLARLLISTIFPFMQTSWNEVLTPAFAAQIVSVQISACFISPVVNLLDIAGTLKRNVLARLPFFVDTQGEINRLWTGSSWSLAERYTGLAKMLFLSLFYTMLSPISMFLAFVAFSMVFFVDRFLLLRRWKATSMLHADIARRLRQQGILAVVFHMIVTLRFIYSWPMDQVQYHSSSETYEVVDKNPKIAFWTLSTQPWMTSDQKSIFLLYYIVTIVFSCFAVYVWIVDPIVDFLKMMFLYQYEAVGDASDITFSSTQRIPIYVPLTTSAGEAYYCCQMDGVLEKNKPTLLRTLKDDISNLSGYIAEERRSKVLSIITYYGHDVEAAQVVVPATPDKRLSQTKTSSFVGVKAEGDAPQQSSSKAAATTATIDGGVEPATAGNAAKIEGQELFAAEKQSAPDSPLRSNQSEFAGGITANTSPSSQRRSRKSLPIVVQSNHPTSTRSTITTTTSTKQVPKLRTPARRATVGAVLPLGATTTADGTAAATTVASGSFNTTFSTLDNDALDQNPPAASISGSSPIVLEEDETPANNVKIKPIG